MIWAPSILPSILPSVRPRFVRPDENLQHQWIFFFRYFTHTIKNNPRMDPVKFRQDQIQNGQLIAIFDQIFENFVRPNEYLQDQ